jgi:hypothetical protein
MDSITIIKLFCRAMGYRKDCKVLLNYKNELEKIKANGKTAYNTKRIDKIWEKLI